MHGSHTITEHAKRQGRSPSQAATLMLALFVFAAIPAVSVAHGLDAALLAELMREDGRRSPGIPARQPDTSPKGLKAAVSLAGSLGSNSAQRIPRPRVAMRRRDVVEMVLPIAASDPTPVMHHLRAALLNLPPPVR